MRVLAFTFGSGMAGGSNRSFAMVLDGLKNNYGYDIDVVLPKKGELCKELDRIGIRWTVSSYLPVSAMESISIENLLRYIKYIFCHIYDVSIANRLAKSAKVDEYDAIYINDNATYIGAILANRFNIPYVWHFRSPRSKTSRHIPGSAKYFRNANTIIAISRSMAEQYKENLSIKKSNIKVIYNGIPLDTNKYEIKNVDSGSKQKGFHIIQCGRISEDKGQFEAIKALESIIEKRNNTNVYLHIVGEALGIEGKKYKDKLIKYVERQKLNENVIFEGYIKNVTSLRLKMDCEVVCSVNEPFGRVTVEAMRCGIPVVGANKGGTVEIITDKKTGLLYDSGNPEDLANKISALIDNEDLRTNISNAAFTYSNTHYLPETVIDEVNNLLQNCKIHN